MTVNYALGNGTATAGSNYHTPAGSITFGPGAKTKTINVSVIGDKRKEANETVVVNLSGAIGGEILDSQGRGTSLNDDDTGGGGSRNGRASSSYSLSVDAAFEDWMYFGRKKPTA